MTRRGREKVLDKEAMSLRVVASHVKSRAMSAIVPRHRIRALPVGIAELEAHELLCLVPVQAHELAVIEGRPEAQQRAVVRLDSVLGMSVKRIGLDGVEHAGRVTAIRGAVSLRDAAGDSRICNGLVEIVFDEFVARLEPHNGLGKRTALLSKSDAGALVLSWNGDAVGIIVAGSKRRAFVAPLSPFAEREDVALGISSRAKESPQPRSRERDLLKMGMQAYVEELAREPMLELIGLTESAA